MEYIPHFRDGVTKVCVGLFFVIEYIPLRSDRVYITFLPCSIYYFFAMEKVYTTMCIPDRQYIPHNMDREEVYTPLATWFTKEYVKPL